MGKSEMSSPLRYCPSLPISNEIFRMFLSRNLPIYYLAYA